MSLSKLRKLTQDDIRRFSLNGHETKAKVLKIFDGDTCDLAFYFEGKLMRYKCRLADIDATELDEEDDQGRDGEIARDFLAWLCVGNDPEDFPSDEEADTVEELQGTLDNNRKLVYAVFGNFGKYGRALVTIKSSKGAGESFNDLLVAYGFADAAQ